MQKLLHLLIGVLFLFSQIFITGCAHKKTIEPVTLSNLMNKRVALAEIGADGESKAHVEVGIINEILEKGRFEIVDRTTVQDAMTAYPTEGDWERLGKKVGADYILKVKLAEFKVTERQGFDKVVEEDSLLTQESGESKTVVGTRYQKVKSYAGDVRLSCTFFDVGANAITYQGYGQAKSTHNSRDKSMPGKMELLERLTGASIREFFEKIPK